MLGAAASVAGGTVAGAAGLFGYNRDNFIYDRKMRQETEYQIMDFRIKQAELWREDVRDIIGLTAVKMDTYLVVNAVQLGFCVMAFCEGRLARGTPTWLIGCHTLSLAGAFMYLLMSVWLAMNASVTAKSYEVRILTQLVRLPVPSWAQLEGARTYCSSFEKLEPRQMFRVPFVQGTQENVLRRSTDSAPAATTGVDAPVATSDGGPETADLWGLEKRGDQIYELDGKVRTDPSKLKHLRLVQEAMQYWQSYDAFARVSMSMGTNQLCAALSYYVLGYVLICNHAVAAAWLTVGLFMSVSVALVRMDISLTSLEFYVSVLLVTSGPIITAFACEQWSRRTVEGGVMAASLMPFSYLAHGLWLMFLLYISRVSEQHGNVLLPTGFRSVMYIDIFGWMRKHNERKEQRRERRFSDVFAQQLVARAPDHALPLPSAGAGPAIQAVSYDAMGRPLPTRPEELPGAAQAAGPVEIRREDFEPTTFVPREKNAAGVPETQEETDEKALAASRARPGFVPWRIFCAATSLLVALWFSMGVVVLFEACGTKVLNIQPLLEQPSPAMAASREAVALLEVRAPMLAGGRLLATTWPKTHIRIHGLACGVAAGDAVELVANSRFGLYAARVSDGQAAVQFATAPSCDAIEGEALQDVAVRCDGNGTADAPICHALVLHQQGQRLASCSLHDSGSPISPKAVDVSSSIGTAWLGEADLLEGKSQEEVSSIALDHRCGGSTAVAHTRSCAYVETTGRRLIELQQEESTMGAPGAWQPARVLLEGMDEARAMPGGTLSAGDGGYLFLLQPGQQKFDALDLARRGAQAGTWRLPENQRWSAVCAAGAGANASLLFLTEGASPQIWRFPMPVSLASANPPVVGTPSTRRSNLRQQRNSQVAMTPTA